MTLRHYSVDIDANDIDHKLNNMADGETHMVAVEIFDHPSARYSAKVDADIGPWVLGPSDEVYAWLEAQGHHDFNEQYSVGGVVACSCCGELGYSDPTECSFCADQGHDHKTPDKETA